MAVTPKFGSFVQIDEALQKRLVKTWAKTVAPLTKDLLEAVADKDFGAAREVAKGVTFDPVFDENVGFITFMMTASILFGSASITSVEESMFVKGPLPEFFDVSRDQLEGMLKIAFSETVRRGIIKVIEDEENRVQDAVVVKLDIDFNLAERLRIASFGGGKVLVNIGANLTTSRLVQFGALAEMTGSKIETYKLQATLDGRTSEICKRLHGRTFKVDRGVDMLASALGTQNPAEVAAIHPWLSGSKPALQDYERLTNKQLNEKYGVLVPPFHPNCRTIVVRTGKVIPKAKFTPVRLAPAPPPEPVIVPVDDVLPSGDLPGKHAVTSGKAQKNVVPGPAIQSTNSLDQIYVDAKAALPEAEAITRAKAEAFGGRAKFRPGGALKDRVRAQQKIDTKYNGEVAQSTDIVGTTIEFKNLDDLYGALDDMTSTLRVRKLNDRFLVPTDEGYRDILLNIEMSNGHVIEIQLHVPEILKAKETGHEFYTIMRGIRDRAKEQGRLMLNAEQVAVDNMIALQIELYLAAFRTAL